MESVQKEKVIVTDFFETVKQRKSVRSYLSTPVSEDAILSVLQAARLAPSAANVQPWHFIVVRSTEKRAAISRGCRYGKFLAQSPVIIVACGDGEASPNWHTVDTAIATEHLVLAATALGLGTCWVGSFNRQAIHELLKLPENYEIVALVALGYSKNRLDLLGRILHFMRRRKKLEKIISFESYHEKATTN